MSIPTDCPQRDERHGWLGDAHLSAEEASLNFDMAAFYTKYLEDIRLAQKEDGSLPDVVPAYMPKLYPADPAWSSAYAILVWLMYRYYGDTRVIERHYLPLKRYVEFLGRNAEDHIIRKLGKYGDWCPPGSIVPKKTPIELTSTWYYYHDVGLVAEMAGILGRKDDEKALRTLAGDIRGAFNRAFLEEDQYASIRVSKVDTYPNQTSNVLPLYLDMAPPEKKTTVLEALLRSVVKYTDHHVDTGILGTRYLLDVMAENGRADDAYKIATRESYPGWGYMVREGATTLWERWENLGGPGMNSHNHIMFGSVDAWFYKNIGGIALIEPGWKAVRIAPTPFKGLTSAEASVMTVRGEVRVRWSSEAKRFTLEATVPVGVSAEVRLPLLWKNARVLEGGTPVWEDGRPMTAVEGVSCTGHSGRDISFKILSGTYMFIVYASDNPPAL
jgi:alpha-L-rhamnosidase